MMMDMTDLLFSKNRFLIWRQIKLIVLFFLIFFEENIPHTKAIYFLSAYNK